MSTSPPRAVPSPDWQKPSLYIHVPFCASFCAYCDFCSVIATPREALGGDGADSLVRFVDRLEGEFSALCGGRGPLSLSTVHLGGGTPSVLGPDLLCRLLDKLAVYARGIGELSVELNPESTDAELLSSLERFRIRALDSGALAPDARMRLSFGVQSLQDASRRAVARAGTGDRVLELLKLAAEYPSFERSVDLMAGLPHQTLRSLLDDIGTVLGTGVDHLSLYALTLEERTPLAQTVLRGECTLPLDDEVAEWLRVAGLELEAKGLYQYEVSNFARDGAWSRHNLRYWQMADWLALGPAAAGTRFDRERGTARRIAFADDVVSWLSGPREGEIEELGREEALFEFLMMGFRLRRGPDEEEFCRRYGSSIANTIPATLAAWGARGLLVPDRAALTREGLFFLNSFLVDVLGELEARPKD